MNNCWKIMSDPCKGLLLIILGATFLLYTLGYLQEGLGIIFIVTSIAMIIYGLILCGADRFIKKLLKKNTPTS